MFGLLDAAYGKHGLLLSVLFMPIYLFLGREKALPNSAKDTHLEGSHDLICLASQVFDPRHSLNSKTFMGKTHLAKRRHWPSRLKIFKIII